MEEGSNRSTVGKLPKTGSRKCYVLKPKIQAPTETRICSPALVARAWRECRRATCHHALLHASESSMTNLFLSCGLGMRFFVAAARLWFSFFLNLFPLRYLFLFCFGLVFVCFNFLFYFFSLFLSFFIRLDRVKQNNLFFACRARVTLTVLRAFTMFNKRPVFHVAKHATAD